MSRTPAKPQNRTPSVATVVPTLVIQNCRKVKSNAHLGRKHGNFAFLVPSKEPARQMAPAQKAECSPRKMWAAFFSGNEPREGGGGGGSPILRQTRVWELWTICVGFGWALASLGADPFFGVRRGARTSQPEVVAAQNRVGLPKSGSSKSRVVGIWASLACVLRIKREELIPPQKGSPPTNQWQMTMSSSGEFCTGAFQGNHSQRPQFAEALTRVPSMLVRLGRFS